MRSKWSRHSDLNRGPAVYETAALPLSYVGADRSIPEGRPRPDEASHHGPLPHTIGALPCPWPPGRQLPTGVHMKPLPPNDPVQPLATPLPLEGAQGWSTDCLGPAGDSSRSPGRRSDSGFRRSSRLPMGRLLVRWGGRFPSRTPCRGRPMHRVGPRPASDHSARCRIRSSAASSSAASDGSQNQRRASKSAPTSSRPAVSARVGRGSARIRRAPAR